MQDVVNLEDHLSWYLQTEVQGGHYFGERRKITIQSSNLFQIQ